MPSSYRLGTFFGIAVRVHWTFGLLLAFTAYSRYTGVGVGGTQAEAALRGVLMILAIFGCVTLHEFGHALTARRFGIRTRDIVLLPFGGVARLEGMPRKPSQEIWIALAGPAVNVVIAGILLPVVMAMIGLESLANLRLSGAGFVTELLMVNLGLIVFNMIPAFPLDGGRVLRALLALRLEYARATVIAARIGQVLAVAFIGLGLMGNPMLIVIGVFVFLAGKAEADAVRARFRIEGLTAGELMTDRFAVIAPVTPVGEADRIRVSSGQTDFPVVDPVSSALAGMLDAVTMQRAMTSGLASASAADVLRRDVPVASEGDPLMGLYTAMVTARTTALPVVREGRLVGMVTMEMLRRAAGG